MTATSTTEPEQTEAAEAVDGQTQAGLDLQAPVRLAFEQVQGYSRTFWIGLALAFTLHASMFVPLVGGYLTASTRRMGEADGVPNSMSVEVVQEAAIPGATAPPPEPPPAPPSPAEPQQQPPPPEPAKAAPPQAKQPPQQVKAELAPKPVPPAPSSVPVAEEARSLPDIRGTTEPDPPPSEAPPAERATAKKPTETAALMKEMTELFAPDPARRAAPPVKTAPPSADPNAPRPVLDAPIEFQGNSSSFARPVDITRSGENDEFGRGVIRALRQTMPSPWGLKSRVTIKFLLTETGQVAEMRLVQGSGYPLVDQSVLFAAGNSSFPRPPRGSKVSDRIFLVTYIYE